MHLYKYLVLRHLDLLASPRDVHMGVVWVQLAGTHPALKHCFKLKPLKAIFNKFLHNKKRFPHLIGRSPNGQVNPIIILTSHYRLEQNIKCLN